MSLYAAKSNTGKVVNNSQKVKQDMIMALVFEKGQTISLGLIIDYVWICGPFSISFAFQQNLFKIKNKGKEFPKENLVKFRRVPLDIVLT